MKSDAWDDAWEAMRLTLLGSGIRPEELHKYMPPKSGKPKGVDPSVLATWQAMNMNAPLPSASTHDKRNNFAGRGKAASRHIENAPVVEEQVVRDLNHVRITRVTRSLAGAPTTISYWAAYDRSDFGMHTASAATIKEVLAKLRTQVPRKRRPRKHVGVLIGLRAWKLEMDGDGPKLAPVGYTSHADQVWTGPITTAHMKPESGGSSGLWSFKPEEHKRFMRDYGTQADVTGFVELYGRVVVHTLGYRAERAMIRALTLHKPWPKIAAMLADRYQCNCVVDVKPFPPGI